ncbi:MAG: NUDIX domain-containing protein [Candidatus Gracilibacteria bacterium]|nr:NUDIX domain-containing protein [Candidatus Gracilibacteria bacterium]
MEKIKKKIIAIIINSEGDVIIGKYNGPSPTWTLPKGGINDGENKTDALFREIYEELGLEKDKFDMIRELEDIFERHFTDEEIEKKVKINGEGYGYSISEHHVFILRFRGNENEIDIGVTNEFSEYKWIRYSEIPNYLNRELCEFLKNQDLDYLFMNMQEYFDIVDENNNLLGIRKQRDIVHKDLKDWHRVSHIWIINDSGEILCQLRSENKDSNPSKWQSFLGGHLKSGQTFDSSSIEELREEIGLDIKPEELIFVYSSKYEPARHFTNVYAVKWNGNIRDLKFNDNEVEEVKFMNLKELEEKIEEGYFCNHIDTKVIEFLNIS